jgi:hypothetical protein
MCRNRDKNPFDWKRPFKLLQEIQYCKETLSLFLIKGRRYRQFGIGRNCVTCSHI